MSIQVYEDGSHPVVNTVSELALALRYFVDHAPNAKEPMIRLKRRRVDASGKQRLHPTKMYARFLIGFTRDGANRMLLHADVDIVKSLGDPFPVTRDIPDKQKLNGSGNWHVLPLKALPHKRVGVRRSEWNKLRKVVQESGYHLVGYPKNDTYVDPSGSRTAAPDGAPFARRNR